MFLRTHTRTSTFVRILPKALWKCSPDFLEREDGEGECDTAVDILRVPRRSEKSSQKRISTPQEVKFFRYRGNNHPRGTKQNYFTGPARLQAGYKGHQSMCWPIAASYLYCRTTFVKWYFALLFFPSLEVSFMSHDHVISCAIDQSSEDQECIPGGAGLC